MILPISIRLGERPTLWRVKHDAELPRGVYRAGLPEVHPVFPNDHVKFQKWAQLVSRKANPWLTDDGWTDEYHFRYWIANNQGFGMENDPRANFVLGKNLTCELPRVEVLVTGGSLVESYKEDETWVYLKALDWDTPVTLEWFYAHQQYWVRGIFCGGDGTPRRMLGNQYDGPPIIHPFLADINNELKIEKYKLQLWTNPFPPDPLKLYL